MKWGPFVENIEPAERLARLRSLRAIARLRCGQRAHMLALALRAAEQDADKLAFAATEFNRMTPLDQRRVLATFAEVM